MDSFELTSDEEMGSFDNNSSAFRLSALQSYPLVDPPIVFYPMGSLLPQMPLDQNNCAARSVMSLVGGALMGFVFGPFLSGFGTSDLDQNPNVSMKTKIIEGWKGMMRTGLRMAKTFGVVGVVFASSECAIEKSRGKEDHWNGIASGCVTGAIISAPGGPSSMAFGCLGFAAFSAGIDWIFKGEDPRDRMVVGSVEDLPIKSVLKKKTKEEIEKISINDLTEEEINAILNDTSLDVSENISNNNINFVEETLNINPNIEKKEF